MNQEKISELTAMFEGHAQKTETGIEFWLARDLQHLLGYSEWRNFSAVVTKAKTACKVSGHPHGDHFVDVNKTIQMPKNAEKVIDDVMLTRFACYLIAQNGDPQKAEIAFAQSCFAIQTRRAELIEQRLLEAERVSARRKLTETEKELSKIIYEQTGGPQDFAKIRSKGDHALFGRSTQSIEQEISSEHIANNAAVRDVLLDRGIRPESLPAAEDVKKVERRLTSEDKRAFDQPEGLEN